MALTFTAIIKRAELVANRDGTKSVRVDLEGEEGTASATLKADQARGLFIGDEIEIVATKKVAVEE